jgi:hypothetical protein
LNSSLPSCSFILPLHISWIVSHLIFPFSYRST